MGEFRAFGFPPLSSPCAQWRPGGGGGGEQHRKEGEPGGHPSLLALVPRAATTARSPTTHGRSASEAILAGVGHRKLALPNVGIMPASGLQLVAPGEQPVGGDTGSARPQAQASGPQKRAVTEWTRGRCSLALSELCGFKLQTCKHQSFQPGRRAPQGPSLWRAQGLEEATVLTGLPGGRGGGLVQTQVAADGPPSGRTCL